jgi:hypothetical protein
MELIYTGDWHEYDETSSTLTIGIYHAYVYRHHRNDTTWRFWVRVELTDDESDSEIATGTALSESDARAAVEAEIRMDHDAHQPS